MDRGYSSRWWGTFRQWQSLGAQVKKRPDDVGQVIGAPASFSGSRSKGRQRRRTVKNHKNISLMRYFTVFNLEQVQGEGLEHLWASNGSNSSPLCADYQPAQQAIEATGADFRYSGDRACYVRPIGKWPKHTDGDYICLPHSNRFESPNEFYSTAFHELVHWSEVRLNWNGVMRWAN